MTMIHAAYDLGASQFQMFREIMASLPDTAYHCRLFYGLHLFARWLCRDLLCDGMAFNPSVEIYSRARKGISLDEAAHEKTERTSKF